MDLYLQKRTNLKTDSYTDDVPSIGKNNFNSYNNRDLPSLKRYSSGNQRMQPATQNQQHTSSRINELTPN